LTTAFTVNPFASYVCHASSQPHSTDTTSQKPEVKTAGKQGHPLQNSSGLEDPPLRAWHRKARVAKDLAVHGSQPHHQGCLRLSCKCQGRLGRHEKYGPLAELRAGEQGGVNHAGGGRGKSGAALDQEYAGALYNAFDVLDS